VALEDSTLGSSSGAPVSPLDDPLTTRAVALLARGKSMAETAGECNVSLRSLERRVADAKSFTGAKTRTHLVVKFLRAGRI
jgi:DNA-binding NarL/FixJ family response regulator